MRFTTAFATALTAVACGATPMPANVASNSAPDTASLIRQGLDLAQNEGAITPQGSTDISIEKEWINDTLFDGYAENPSTPS